MPFNFRSLSRLVVASFISCISIVWANPGDILFEDDFEGTLAKWVVDNSGGGDASIGNETSASGNSLRLRWDTVSIRTIPINAAVPNAQLTAWIRRGDDSFSEDPERISESLTVEYLNSSLVWTSLVVYPGGNPTGEIFTPTFILPSDALHANLQIRFTFAEGDGVDWDYWHVDDVVVTEIAAPLFCDNFESGLGNWNIIATTGSAGTSSQTFSSASNSMFTRWGVVTVESTPNDTSSAGALTVTAWIRRGDDSFSEDPDPGEDLILEYRNNLNNWIELESFLGSGTNGEVHSRSYLLPIQALHANFQIRFRQTGGSGTDWDYWHVDDVCFINSNPSVGNCNANVADLFGSAAFNNNDGSAQWTSDWIELLDNNSPTGTDAYISGGVLVMHDHNNAFRNPSWEREIDLTNATQASFEVNLSTSNTLENGDRFEVGISVDGGINFAPVQAFSNDFSGLYTYDLTPYLPANIRIRFKITGGYRSNDEWIEIDNVSISYTKNCGPDHFDIDHDNAAINCYREGIVIKAVDSLGAVIPDYTGTIDISNTTNHGDWYTLDNLGASTDLALGTLTNGVADDGAASYTFVAGDLGQVTLYLHNTYAETTNINVVEGAVTDDNTEGNMIFRPFGFTASPVPISTQVAGRPFNVALTAAGQTPSQPQCGVIEEYTGVQNIHFWSTYSSPATGVTQVQVDGTNIAASEPASTAQNVTFTNGVANLSVNYNDVGSISIHAKDEVGIGDPVSGTADEIIGGIAPFIVRPFGYDIQPSGNPNATGPADPVYAAASTIFITTLRSVLWDAADDGDNDGIPDGAYDFSNNGVTPNIVNIVGTISLTPTAQVVTNSNGSLTTTSINYSSFPAASAPAAGTINFVQAWNEVGILTIDALTNNFMASGFNISGQRANIGRFTPGSFNLAITDDFSSQCGVFSYGGFNNGVPGLIKSGQTDDITYTIEARNLGNILTQNYDGVFAYLESGTTTRSPFNVTAAAAATGTLNSTLSAINFTSGSANVTVSNIDYQFDALQAAFDLRVDINATDSDGITGLANSASVPHRLGRLQLRSTYGSELQMLEMPLFTEYYNGTQWAINTVDGCTPYINTDLVFVGGSYQGNLDPGETSAILPVGAPELVIGGRSDTANGFWFSASGDTAGVPNTGEVNVYFDLTNLNWLVHDWDNDNNNDNPTATVGFGRHRGSDRIIYWKEF